MKITHDENWCSLRQSKRSIHICGLKMNAVCFSSLFASEPQTKPNLAILNRTINNAGNQITIYLHPLAQAVMIFFVFVFIYSYKRVIWKSISCFSPPSPLKKKKSKQKDKALIPASSSRKKNKQTKNEQKSLTVHAVHEKHIKHRDAIWTTNDSHHNGHQSGCYCRSVLINLDQASRILCRQ